jgi:homoserine O-acetyltransferase
MSWKLALAFWLAGPGSALAAWPGQSETDVVLHDVTFASGEIMPELKLHVLTLGSRNDPAVLLLHGTSGTGRQWLTPEFADEMFGPGKPLDAGTHYIIIPDGIGRGGSSKPSDGLKMAFPHYRYADMVRATYRQLTEGLGVSHLRLVLGASMGGMQAWMWAGMYPDFMDGVVPMASQPVRISGRNWISRRVAIEAIRNDPGWQGGAYSVPPVQWTITAPGGRLATDNVLALQARAGSVQDGDALYRQMVEQARRADARDALFATEAVMDYAPEELLPRIKAPVMAINSADDMVNPPELHTMEAGIARIPSGARYVLLPADITTRGHYTYEQAAKWGPYLGDFLRSLPAR